MIELVKTILFMIPVMIGLFLVVMAKPLSDDKIIPQWATPLFILGGGFGGSLVSIIMAFALGI